MALCLSMALDMPQRRMNNMNYGPSKDIIDYSALLVSGQGTPHPWASIDGYVPDCKNYGHSLAVRFRRALEYGDNTKAWRAYLIKDWSKVEGGLDGMTL